jgi:hypothetical protein
VACGFHFGWFSCLHRKALEDPQALQA